MFCIHCGKENRDGAQFCASCGKPVESRKPQESPPTPPKETIPAPPAASPPTEITPPKSLKVLGIIGIILGSIQLLFNIIAPLVALAEVLTIGGAESAAIAIIISMVLMTLSSLALLFGSIGLLNKKLWGRTLCLIFGWSAVPLLFISVVAVQTANAYMATKGVDRSFEVMVGGGCFSPILGIVMLAILMTGEVARWVVYVRTGKVPVEPGKATASSEGTIQVQQMNVPALLSLILFFVPLLGLNWIASIILGFVGLSGIKKSNGLQKGRGLAITGITLSSAAFILIVAGIVFAILGPMMMARRAAGERSAILSLRSIVSAQEQFRMADYDMNGKPDYWVGDVAGLSLIDGTDLIDPGVVGADAEPVHNPPKGVRYSNPPGAMSPRNGYFYLAIPSYETEGGSAKLHDQGEMRNDFRWAVCAYPSDYPDSGKFTLIISQAGEVFKKDTGGSRCEVFPLDPIEEGWEYAD